MALIGVARFSVVVPGGGATGAGAAALAASHAGTGVYLERAATIRLRRAGSRFIAAKHNFLTAATAWFAFTSGAHHNTSYRPASL